MCIRDRYQRRVRGSVPEPMASFGSDDDTQSNVDDVSYSSSDEDEQPVDSEAWDERNTYVKTLTNDRAWVIQRSFNDGEAVPADKLPSDPNFVNAPISGDALYATVLKLQNKWSSEHELVGIELVEEPCMMQNLRPGMLIKVKANEMIPADILPVAQGNSSGYQDVAVLDTAQYDDVRTLATMPKLLVRDIITDDQQLKNHRFYARAQASSFALQSFRGAVTYAEEDEAALLEARQNVYRSEQKENLDGKKTVSVGGPLSKSSGLEGHLHRKELTMEDKDLLCYRMKFQAADPNTVLYGLCVYTGDDTKYRKWEEKEQERWEIKGRGAGGPRRPRYPKAKKVNVVSEAKATHHSTKKHQTFAAVGATNSESRPLTDDEEESKAPVVLEATKNEKKRRMIWIGIIVAIIVVCGAVAGIVIGVVGTGSSDSSASSPGSIGTVTASTSAKGTSLYLSFTEPANNGATITGYTCAATGGGSTVSTSGSALCSSGTCVFECTGLTAAVAYSTTVSATNAVGTGSASAAVSFTTVDQQIAALSALYTATTGSGWESTACPYSTAAPTRSTNPDIDNKNWFLTTSATFNAAGDYCSTSALTDGTGAWAGVTCNSDGFITGLSLNGVGLKGTIPTEIGYLTGLTNLNLGLNPNNLLTTYTSNNHGSIDSKDTNVPTTCQLVDNARGSTQSIGLSGSLPTEIGKLTGLTDFDMSFTFVSGTVPSEFSSLSQLTSFKVQKVIEFCYKSATTTAALSALQCSTDNSFTSTTDPFYTFLNALKTSGTCNTEQDDEVTATPAAGTGLPCGV
eukprot:TRINITY_DN5669_c0_g1_i1.p1 TRINITY_DN5669_c0_g1~~TRINITY_DN5669_c0_g1_i1.p1  ORF type:complete len:798 (+),score=265.49 TRINITY_DN5669_c0_g1_i1:89-2482(+)